MHSLRINPVQMYFWAVCTICCFLLLYYFFKKNLTIQFKGDLSFSFEPIDTAYQHWKTFFTNAFKFPIVPKTWVVLFSRSKNFGHGVKIHKDKVYIKSMEDEELVFPLTSVVWATTNSIEDEEHFSQLKEKYEIDASRIFFLGSIEQMWALVAVAPRVLSDRYHAGHLPFYLFICLSLYFSLIALNTYFSFRSMRFIFI